MSQSAIPGEYRCPGEKYTISRSIHLARLAAYYPKCTTCSHKFELGAWEPPPIPLPIVHHPGADAECGSSEPSCATHGLIFTTEGVRGVYLNTLTRSTAGEVTAAFAYSLWEQVQSASPPGGMPTTSRESSVTRTPGRTHRGPTVVIAHDERPSSPDLVMGVAATLRRMGCRVIDVGPTTRPEFVFAVHHLRSDGGVYVTGAGCDPAWSGLEFAGQDGAPWSLGGKLDSVQARFITGVARPSRSPGSQRLFSITQPYEACLLKYWHGLRPLRIACALPGRRVRDLFERLFEKLPCKLISVPTPVRGRSMSDPDDPDLARTADAVRANRAHLGFLVSEEGDACAFFDERGELVYSGRLLAMLAQFLLDQRATVSLVSESKIGDGILNSPSVRTVTVNSNRESIWQAWDQHRADLAGGPSGRYWFDTSGAVCDAIVTVAHVLQALSRDDTPFSELRPK